MDLSRSSLIRLDSTQAGSNWSFAAAATSSRSLVWPGADQPIQLYEQGQSTRQWSNPLEALRWLETEARSTTGGGERWIGYLSYDMGRSFESLPVRAADDLGLPLMAFVQCAPSTEEISESRVLAEKLIETARREIRSTFTRPAYLQAVRRAIEYIAAGDVFQVNLSQRFSLPQPASARQIYQRLLSQSAAAYGALLDFGSFALICNSPELFLRIERDPKSGDRRLTTRPIKGTRSRQPGMDLELLRSAKDQAELNMIVDLERNDLGRVCRVGSVKVTQPRTIEAHPTVFHGVATIEGILRDDCGFAETIGALFPGGSITGAPKIRAMEIIEELEPVRRGPYCGAIGYLAADGSAEFNIAIRTMIVKDGQIHIPVGGGIVADSDPDAEYEETLVKARAMFAALGK
ncbi:MAG TPA: chorismate-binding protein [Tepidisphaeraceae bacterium]|nr:chorismate-binding protein [Tepidisphaeraceae bacterium]